MKRLLAFLVLFGAGLALLARLEAGGPNLPEGTLPASERAAFPTREVAFAGTSALELRGPFSLLRYAEAPSGPRPTRLSLEAQDTETRADGEIVFKELDVIWNDAESGTPRVTIHATLGSMRLTESGQRYPIDFEEDVAEDRLVLEGVEIVLHQGGPVTPLTLKVDRLEGDLSDRLFSSDSRAEARGPGLDATGQGLLLDLIHDVVRFDSDAEVRFVDDAGSAVLTSEGKMHVLKGSKGGAEVVARDGARLHLVGEEEVDVEARRINIIATSTEGSDGSKGTRLSRLSADDEAVVELAMGRFEAKRADLEISPLGNMRARLTGAPRAALALSEQEGDRKVELDVAGEGPLTITVATQRSFELKGPATVEWEENRLDAEGGLRGFAEGNGMSVSCWGGVQLTQPTAVLETSALDLRVARSAEEGNESSVLQITTNGDSHLEGIGETGEPYKLDAEQVVYEQLDGQWALPLALGVDLEIRGDLTTTVVADRVERFEPIGQTFVAGGAVELNRGEYRAVGDRCVGLSPDHFVLEGTDESLASVKDRDFYAEGLRIEREGERFSAQGSAAAQVSRDGSFAELHAESLYGTVSPKELESGEREVFYDLRSEGGVSFYAEESAESARAEGGTLHAQLVERVDSEGEVLESRALLEFDGGLKGETRTGSEHNQLKARSARLERSGLNASWTGTARGEVTISRSSPDEPSFQGEGDELEIDANGVARLGGLDGEVVRFDGVLPGGRYPFVLEAPAAEISPNHVKADNARIWVRTLSLLPGPKDELEVDSEIVARADRFSAVEGELLLGGSVQVSGVDDAGEELVLDSGFLRFEGSEEQGDDKSVIQRMYVWGGFDFQYGDGFSAHGDRLEARATTGRLQISGSPARVEYGDFMQVADKLEFDLFLRMIVEASAGYIRAIPRTPSAETPQR